MALKIIFRKQSQGICVKTVRATTCGNDIKREIHRGQKMKWTRFALPPANSLKGCTPTAAVLRFYFDSRREKDEVNLVHPLLTQPNPANLMDRGAQQATVNGVTRVGHNLATKPPPVHPNTQSEHNHRTWSKQNRHRIDGGFQGILWVGGGMDWKVGLAEAN